MEDLDLALSGLEKIHKVVNNVSPFLVTSMLTTDLGDDMLVTRSRCW